MKTYAFILIIAVFTIISCSEKKNDIKVACVGNSITQGSGIYWESKYSYPVQLDSILGTGYSVINCGRSGATMLKKSDLPYWRCNELHNVFAFKPDVIVIKLGTNDTKGKNWNEENFKKDYQAMIDTFKTIASNPKIYVCFPVPAYNRNWDINDSIVQNGVIPAVKDIAETNNLHVIDLYEALSNHVELFPDSIHPNPAGAKIMAETIAKELTQCKK